MPDSPTLDDDTTERPPIPTAPSGERTVAGMPVRLLVVGTLVALILAVAAGAMVAVSDDGGDDDDVVSLQDDDVLEPVDEAAVVGAPVALDYQSFEGEALNTARYLGTPLVLNFFAEWCPPCVREMPAFEQVHQANLGEVAFLGLSTQEPVEDGQAIIDATGITYDVGRDESGDVFAHFQGTGMPTTVLIDAAGTVREVHSGELTAPELQALIDEHFG